MVFKLILFILVLVAFAFFTGFNLDNKCNIWFFFKTFENVPVFMNTLVSFAFGILCAIPITLIAKFHSHKKTDKSESSSKKGKEKNKNAENKIEYISDKKDESKEKKSAESKSKDRASILEKIQNLKKSKDDFESQKNDSSQEK